MTQRKYTHRTPKQWQDHIHHQKESGLTISAYCQQQGLAVSNFYGWRKKLLNTNSESTHKAQDLSAAWVALTPEPVDIHSTPAANTSTDITLTLPGNIQLTIRCH